MKTFSALFAAVALFSASAHAGTTVRIIPSPGQATVDGSQEQLVKRMPMGGEFMLTVNKGQDISYYQLQWYKDGIKLDGETGQTLQRPFASTDMNGVYTVTMASPCATVTSKPIRVLVERRTHLVNSQLNEVTAGDNATMDVYQLEGCQPNPAVDRTVVNFTTRQEAPVTVKIVDLTGNEVVVLVNDVLPAGDHTVMLNIHENNMAASAYFVVMSAPGFTESKPLMIVK